MLPGHHLAIGRREDRQQAHLCLLAADSIPRNPDAIGSTEIGLAEVLGELLGGEHIALIRRTIFRHFTVVLRIIERIDRELAIDRNGVALVVIEVQASAEATRRLVAGRVVDGVGPDRDHAHRRIILALLFFLFFLVLVFVHPRERRFRHVDGHAAGVGEAESHEQNEAEVSHRTRIRSRDGW